MTDLEKTVYTKKTQRSLDKGNRPARNATRPKLRSCWRVAGGQSLPELATRHVVRLVNPH